MKAWLERDGEMVGELDKDEDIHADSPYEPGDGSDNNDDDYGDNDEAECLSDYCPEDDDPESEDIFDDADITQPPSSTGSRSGASSALASASRSFPSTPSRPSRTLHTQQNQFDPHALHDRLQPIAPTGPTPENPDRPVQDLMPDVLPTPSTSTCTDLTQDPPPQSSSTRMPPPTLSTPQMSGYQRKPGNSHGDKNRHTNSRVRKAMKDAADSGAYH